MIVPTIFAFALYMVKVVSSYSPFRLADIEDFLAIEQSGALDWTVLGPLLLVSAVLYALSLLSFRRRLP